MSLSIYKTAVLIILCFLCCLHTALAGPPFYADDPQPVDFRHWEFYISSVNTIQTDHWSGTSPHMEVNYGLIPHLQIHLLLPLNYDYPLHQQPNFGYAKTEFGVKYCFIHETATSPQVGIFPVAEIPTFRNPEFNDGKMQLFIPVWAQKSWGKLTSYGGIGYGINPGSGHKNWIFSGWEIQYDFSPKLMLGGELYYHTADAVINDAVLAANLGGSINFTQKFHFIFSLGHNLINQNFTSSYLGLLCTI